jgi:hypothetical protein
MFVRITYERRIGTARGKPGIRFIRDEQSNKVGYIELPLDPLHPSGKCRCGAVDEVSGHLRQCSLESCLSL